MIWLSQNQLLFHRKTLCNMEYAYVNKYKEERQRVVSKHNQIKKNKLEKQPGRCSAVKIDQISLKLGLPDLHVCSISLMQFSLVCVCVCYVVTSTEPSFNSTLIV